MFNNNDYWNGIILYGLNNATYKIALGKCLLDLAKKNIQRVTWEELSRSFIEQYLERLKAEQRPQQAHPSRLTTMERIVSQLRNGQINFDEAVAKVGRDAFDDVVPRFHTIGTDKEIVKERFYEFDFEKTLNIKDSVFSILENNGNELFAELDARWCLLEGAFAIKKSSYVLSNDIREIYLEKGSERKNLTKNIPFLNGYQNNICFYCAEKISDSDIHVDHVLPRQVVSHDEIWNLVLCHSTCNMHKGDMLVGDQYIIKLILRNENIMGSNHPWKYKIMTQLGDTSLKRKIALQKHYQNVKDVLGAYYWGGFNGYSPESDSFYRALITKINNR